MRIELIDWIYNGQFTVDLSSEPLIYVLRCLGEYMFTLNFDKLNKNVYLTQHLEFAGSDWNSNETRWLVKKMSRRSSICCCVCYFCCFEFGMECKSISNHVPASVNAWDSLWGMLGITSFFMFQTWIHFVFAPLVPPALLFSSRQLPIVNIQCLKYLEWFHFFLIWLISIIQTLKTHMEEIFSFLIYFGYWITLTLKKPFYSKLF